MSGRVEALIGRFERANDEVIATVQGCSDQQWRSPCSGEQWPVAVTAHHIGTAYRPLAEMIRALATGQPLPAFTSEMLEARNAEHAQQYAGCSREETVELLRRGGREATAILRGLRDEQLDNGGPLPLLGGQPRSAAQLAEQALLGHTTGHLESIRAAL